MSSIDTTKRSLETLTQPTLHLANRLINTSMMDPQHITLDTRWVDILREGK